MKSVKTLLVVGLLSALPGITGAGTDAGVFSNGFEGGEAPNVGPCDSEFVAPAGWQSITKPWNVAWDSPRPNTPTPTYPFSGGYPVPVGAEKGGYTVIPFVPNANEDVAITWDTVQPQPGYSAPRVANQMTFKISACPGDFRLVQGYDPCGRISAQDSIFYSTKPHAPAVVCKLDAGVTYYLNIIAVNPMDGIFPALNSPHTCSDVSPWTTFGCDVQAVHSPQ